MTKDVSVRPYTQDEDSVMSRPLNLNARCFRFRRNCPAILPRRRSARVPGRLRAPETLHHAGPMSLHRARADIDVPPDLLVGAAGKKPLQDLALAG